MRLLFIFCLAIVRTAYSIRSNAIKDVYLVAESSAIKTTMEFLLKFAVSREFNSTDTIRFTLPRFTRSIGNITSTLDAAVGGISVTPSNVYEAGWIEGNYSTDALYFDSQLIVKARPGYNFLEGTSIEIIIEKSNHISVFCGSPSSDVIYNSKNILQDVDVPLPSVVISYYENGAYLESDSVAFTSFNEFVDPRSDACKEFNDCNGHGRCDHCYQKCICIDGFGSDSDIVVKGRDLDGSCRQRVCPAGPTMVQLPSTDYRQERELSECSSVGSCNRETGECSCTAPFGGAACDRITCPNTVGDVECSGHGECLSMRALSLDDATVAPVRWTAPRPHPYNVYGSGEELNPYNDTMQLRQQYGEVNLTSTNLTISKVTPWDAHRIVGCKCHSSWAVGIDQYERQVSEYFGPDCSQKRCPSGDNPFTNVNEEDCTNKTQVKNGQVGYGGNRCHIDCSNRGTCDYNTGRCSCYAGSYGENCGLVF